MNTPLVAGFAANTAAADPPLTSTATTEPPATSTATTDPPLTGPPQEAVS